MRRRNRDRRKPLLFLPALVFLVAAIVAQPGVWAVPNQQTTVPTPLPGQVLLDVYGRDPEALVSIAGDVRIDVPAGAVIPLPTDENAVTLRYTPEQAGWEAPNADPWEIGHVFSLETWKWGTAGPWLTGFSFQLPIWVQINYTPDDVTAAAGRDLKVAYNVGQSPFNWVLLSNQTYGADYIKGQITTFAPSQQTWFALVAPPALTAESTVSTTADASKYGIVPVAISAVKDAAGNPATIPGLGSYSATASYSSLGIEIKQVRGGTAPFDTPTSNIQATTTTFSDSQTGSTPQPPHTVVSLVPILTGSALDSYGLTVTFDSIIDTASAPIGGGAPVTLSLMRGNANKDATVNIVDALFIAQYLALKRPITDLNAVNAATPRHDSGVNGDQITIVDALYIAQYKATLRDADYNQLF